MGTGVMVKQNQSVVVNLETGLLQPEVILLDRTGRRVKISAERNNAARTKSQHRECIKVKMNILRGERGM